MRTAMLSWTVRNLGLPNIRSFRIGPRQEHRGPVREAPAFAEATLRLRAGGLALTAAGVLVLGVTLGGQGALAGATDPCVDGTNANTLG